MRRIYYLFIVVLIVLSCTSWKTVTNTKGGTYEAIENAINDFIKSNKHASKDTVFFIYTKEISEDILGVNVSATYDKVLISTEDNISYTYEGLPSGFIEKGNNFFYWHDEVGTNPERSISISVLQKFNLLDTMIVNAYMPPSTVSHDTKVTDYYFCKNELSRFKKVRTTKAMGYYKVPKLRCN